MAGLGIDGSKEFTFDQSDLARGINNFNGHLTLHATVVETATREKQVVTEGGPHSAEVTKGGPYVDTRVFAGGVTKGRRVESQTYRVPLQCFSKREKCLSSKDR
eukprot:6437766-Pyramimonas_sp.AAC.1